MEPKFQTSFIPKTPITTSSSSSFKAPGSISIIGTFSTIFFVLVILVSGGLFVYERSINSNITQSQNALVQAKSAFESADNKKIILVSNQLKSIKALLSGHTVVSPLFALLEAQTLPTVKFTTFSFTQDATGVVSITIEGDAQSYASLAQQSSIFSSLPYLKKVEFNDITLSELGTVHVKIKAVVDPEILLYTKKIQAVSVAPSYLLTL